MSTYNGTERRIQFDFFFDFYWFFKINLLELNQLKIYFCYLVISNENISPNFKYYLSSYRPTIFNGTKNVSISASSLKWNLSVSVMVTFQAYYRNLYFKIVYYKFSSKDSAEYFPIRFKARPYNAGGSGFTCWVKPCEKAT